MVFEIKGDGLERGQLMFLEQFVVPRGNLRILHEDQIAALLTRDPRMTRKPVTPQDVFNRREFVTDDGDLRTLPMHLPDSDPRWAGLDGFYAARLTRKSA